ncbi:MAG: hypothetical protein JO083_06615 [Candidatus Eremiobacteraeota bacterium]|nr:hypothetical protein [Candidatus Eremiobacteraeota bacterium]
MLVEVNRHRFTIVLPSNFEDVPVSLIDRLKRRGPVCVCVPADQHPDAADALGGHVDYVVPIRDRSWLPIEATIAGALELMNAQPYQTVAITDSTEVLGEVIPTRLGTVLVGVPDLETLPDDHVSVWPEALRPPGRIPGWFGELALSDQRPGRPISNRGAFLIVDKSKEIEGAGTARVIILGRSFPRSDARFDKHQYTQRILRLKGDGGIERFARGVAAVFPWLRAHGGVDVITRVPPRPGHTDPLGEVAARAGTLSNVQVDLDRLERVREYIPQKGIGDYENRRQNVRGAFRAADFDNDFRVVLIDDIYTSGSTALECARTLVVAGATHVDIIAFGKNQHLITPTVGAAALQCGNCGSPMRLRISAKENAYWQCTQWRHCDNRDYYDKGLRASNELNTRPGSGVDDIDF